MADWYVSSAAYAAIPVWAASTAYTVGQIRRPTTLSINGAFAFRCTVAGTSAATEPTWTTNDNSTRTDGTATWTNVSGQSAYGWSAAAGTLFSLAGASGVGTNRNLIGDRVFISSDHSETNTTVTATYRTNSGTSAFGVVQHISVNRAGSVPPVAADVLAGAAIINNNSVLTLDAYAEAYWQGVSFSSVGNIQFNTSTGTKAMTFKNCTFNITGGNASSRYTTGNASKIILDNTTCQFSNVGQYITAASSLDWLWLNTAAPIAGATIPSSLFASSVNAAALVATCRGADFSAITGTILNSATAGWAKILLDSCKIASGATRYGVTSVTNPGDEIELVNCFDGTNALNERHAPAGAITTDRNTTMTGGAQDDIGAYSLKMVSSARSDKLTMPLDCFWIDVGNTATGASKIATVEIVSSASLNNDEISLLLEYMGTSGSSMASFVSSLPATPLTAAAALASSSVSWNSPPTTPQKQKLAVTFTPQRAGRVRGLVRLGKPSTTVWVNPQITIT